MQLYIRIIFPFFIITSVYTLLTFFFGYSGIYSQRKLKEEITNVIKNISIIKQKGIELDVLIKNLTSDEQTIKIFAHDLGYINENEGIIKLTSLKSNSLLDNISYGSAIKIHRSAYMSDSLCKRFAILMGIISFIIEMLIVKSYDPQEKRSTVYSYN